MKIQIDYKIEMINKTSKEAIIWLRRKNQARTTIGKLLYSMYKQKKSTIAWVKNVCSLLKMDPRVLKKHIWFRFYPQWWRENYILNLDTEDMLIIKETEKIFKRLRDISHDRQKIAQYIFFYLIKNG